MYEITCLDSEGNSIDNFTQWDINQKIRIVFENNRSNYFDITPQVHFANSKRNEALVVAEPNVQVENVVVNVGDVTTTVTADVPNVLLQEAYPLFIYLYVIEKNDDVDYLDDNEQHIHMGDSQKTLVYTEIPIRKRERPSDYVYVENIERITAEQIKKELAHDFSNGELPIKHLTFLDIQDDNAPHRIYVSNHKLILENVDAPSQNTLNILDTRDFNNIRLIIEKSIKDAVKDKADKTEIPKQPSDINAEVAGTANSKVSEHNTSASAHNDIRNSINEIDDKVDKIIGSLGGLGYMRIGDYVLMPNSDGHLTLTYVGTYAFNSDSGFDKLIAAKRQTNIVDDTIVNVGAPNKPIYISDGVPIAIDNYINKSVPEDAAFTYEIVDDGAGNVSMKKKY